MDIWGGGEREGGGGGGLIDRLISYWLYYIGALSFFLSFFLTQAVVYLSTYQSPHTYTFHLSINHQLSTLHINPQ